jgi:ABC-2 type transport system ATP-binding protein
MQNAEVSNLTKHFGELVAVDHISFQVKKGELFGFLGPNAAGKTTTIRMLTGVIKPDEGAASILSYDILREGIKTRQFMGMHACMVCLLLARCVQNSNI